MKFHSNVYKQTFVSIKSLRIDIELEVRRHFDKICYFALSPVYSQDNDNGLKLDQILLFQYEIGENIKFLTPKMFFCPLNFDALPPLHL